MKEFDYYCFIDRVRHYDIHYLLAIKRFIKNNIKFVKSDFKKRKSLIDFKFCDSITYNKFLDMRSRYFDNLSCLKKDFNFIKYCILNFTNYIDFYSFFNFFNLFNTNLSSNFLKNYSVDYLYDFFNRYSYSQIFLLKTVFMKTKKEL